MKLSKAIEFLGIASMLSITMLTAGCFLWFFGAGQYTIRFMHYNEGWIELPLFLLGSAVGIKMLVDKVKTSARNKVVKNEITEV